ncbi:MAG: aminotransferase class V-fold PLP-dependent enzyme [Cytophagaceae bacterium]
MSTIKENTEREILNFEVDKIREQFPVLNQTVNGKPLTYLDNAATTQKPKIVINSLVEYYSSYNANIHRGIHTLAEKATAAFEETREAVRKFINAKETAEVIFTKGTTESINLVASTYGRKFVGKGDEIIVSGLEHHSNMVPWQMLAEEKGAIVKIIPVDQNGDLIIDFLDSLISEKTKIVAVNHVSNTLGTINPIKIIIDKAHNKGIPVLIDGAQAASHLDLDVQALDADFYAFSAHKMYGPTGIGVLYGKRELLEAMPPYQGGGEMISEVSYEKCSYNELPYKFEAGTPNIADTIALKSAIDFISSVGKAAIRQHENVLLEYATGLIREIKDLKIVGTAKEKVSVISFVIEGVHHQDLGIILDKEGIAIRTGHHCTQPLMGHFKIAGTSRASFAVYNTMEEVDKLIAGINKAVRMLK